MPEYLAPGVFVEETSFRSRSIQAVGTSTTAFVGPARKGPVGTVSEVITSFGEFERVYGGVENLTFGSAAQTNYLAHSARAYFDNGGARLYVSRVFNASGTTHASARVPASGAQRGTFHARMPGSGLNGEVRIFEKRTPASRRALNVASEGSLAVVGASPATSGTLISGPAPFAITDGQTLRLRNDNESGVTITFNAGNVTLGAATAQEVVDAIAAEAGFNGAATVEGGAVRLTSNSTGASSRMRVITSGGSASTSDLGWPETDNNGAAASSSDTFYEKSGDSWSPTAGANLDLDNLPAGVAIATYNIEATDADGVTIIHERLGLGASHPRSLMTVLAETPTSKADAMVAPYWFQRQGSATAIQIRAALYASPNADDPLLTTFAMTGGSDGAAAMAVDSDDFSTSYAEALETLEAVDDIAIVAAPGSSALEVTQNQGAQDALISHCERMRYRIAVLDTPEGETVSGARNVRARIDTSHAALYYPWVMVPNPLVRPGDETIPKELALPPSGFVCGIYARNDIERGVWKAPANEVVRGALRFAQDINKGQQEVLNPEGVNCLRSFFGRGNRVWGARTCSSDPEWIYVNIRRYFIYLEHSIDNSTQWAVFEPNGERLWANIRETISSFLYAEWRAGALMGASPEEAFFVRCDRSTMTQADFDNGRLICEIGVAALKPAEFVIFRIGQKTADADG